MSSDRPPADPDIWDVPTAASPVSATVRTPGSKSMTNRALVLAALAQDPTQIAGPLLARDSALMTDAMRRLGCVITADAGTPEPSGARVRHDGRTSSAWSVVPGAILADGGPGHARAAQVRRGIDIDVGNAGTVLRFVPPAAALTGSDVRFTGDPRVRERPVAPLLDALRDLGARIDDDGAGAVPFVVHGEGHLRGGKVTMDASASSQFISGLLLSAARFDDGVQITHAGPPVPSAPHIDMTITMLRARGVEVISSPSGRRSGRDADPARSASPRWQVVPGPIRGGRIEIEPDLSNALPFLAAALVTGGQVTAAGWPATSLQPAARIIELLTTMGAVAERADHGLRVTGSGHVRGIDADLSEIGELTPVLTALAALADSPSEFTGIGHLRTHETDRLAALAGEIGKLGGDVTELDDGLRIRPRTLRADDAIFDSHDDHRLVMAAAVLGLAVPGLRVRNAATAAKTFPGFGEFWTQTIAPAK